MASIIDERLHVGTYIEALTRVPALSAPTIKLRLAAIRRLFDGLATGNVGLNVNPAASVRGPSHVYPIKELRAIEPGRQKQHTL